MIDNQRIVIIGGGLSGLTLAYLLSKKNINVLILEASARLGGRIQTVKGKLRTPLELGATWFSDMHPNQPFWRNDGYSGMLYSHAGIITEMYDHTNFEENKFGFTGFLNGGAAAYLQEVRKELVLRQLGDLIGEKALNPTAYFDKVWTNEFILAGNQIIKHPHQDNGHPLLQQSYMNGNLYFAATETATQYPGYMEGAVIAARSVFEKLTEGTP
ncbi:NAD(P)/FAD-dependent oxidoreductase [Sphingobacterium mizutaii]|uniref:FAD-dependent oxidoreductase n=1 Tax=Sphingobacterium mizutaii TaxID=1010 RepID=UPI001626BF81|nr:NAD(P)/FAD-dependent oxidoreductase [Sphingobacterium mizutaii]